MDWRARSVFAGFKAVAFRMQCATAGANLVIATTVNYLYLPPVESTFDEQAWSIVAVLDTPDPHAAPLRIIAEVQDTDVPSLIERAYALYEKYGATSTVIPWLWYGESDAGYDAFLYRFNEGVRRTGTKEQFFLASPPHFQLPTRFEFYCRVLYSLLPQGGTRRLFFFPESLLPAYLKNISLTDAVTGTTKDHPAISAAGYVVSALTQYEPWLMTVQDEGPGSDAHSIERFLLREQASTDGLLRAAFGVDDDSLIFEPCGGD